MPNKLTESRLRKTLKKTAAPQTGWLDVFPAVIGTASGTVQTGVPGIIYVRNFLNGQVLSVYNFVTPNTAGLQVEVGRKVETPGLWQVKGVREAYAQPAGGVVGSASHTHADLFIGLNRFLPFLIFPVDGSGFDVKIIGNVFPKHDGSLGYVVNQTLDLSSYVPASGALYILLETNDDGTIQITEGAVVAAKELLVPSDIPALNPENHPSCAVRLYAGQAQLYRDPNSINDFVDLRIGFHNGLLNRLGMSVPYDLQYMQNVIHSAGWVSGGEITDNGDGTVDVAAGIGLIRAADDSTSELFFMDWAASADVSLTDDSNNWVYVDYNSGSPTIASSTSKPSENNTKFILASVYKSGNDLHINNGWRHTTGDHAGLMMEMMAETMPFAHASGGDISEVGTLQFSISEGNWWYGLTKLTTPAFDGTADEFFYYYHSSGVWTEASGQTAIDPDQYDDGSDLQSVTANRYSAHWGFISTNGDVHVIYGTGNYTTLALAQAAGIPADLPPEVLADSRFLFKIIVQQGQTSFESIESALDVVFQVTGGGGAVDSVNGQTGTVVLDADDIDDTSTTNKFATAAQLAQIATNQTDISDHIGDTNDAHDASAISVFDSESHWTGTDVEAVLQEIGNGIVLVETQSNDIFRCDNCGASSFSSTIATLPGGSTLTYGTVTGADNILVPVSTSQIGKMRLYNTTRGNYALISNCVTGTKTITLTASVPGTWQVGDTITTVSPTVGAGWLDIELTSPLSGKNVLIVEVALYDSGGSGQTVSLHPFESLSAPKIKNNYNHVAARWATYERIYEVNSDVMSLGWTASGAATLIARIREAATNP